MSMLEGVHAETFRSGRGAVTIALVAPRVLLCKADGHYDEPLAAHYVRAMTHASEYGPAELFLDWENLTGYDSECRRLMTQFMLDNRARFTRAHILVRNRLVAMGVSTAALLIGDGLLEAYTERSRFEQRLRDVLSVRKVQP
jgi:hypothetical protein